MEQIKYIQKRKILQSLKRQKVKIIIIIIKHIRNK
jgi:hypothetical protein